MMRFSSFILAVLCFALPARAEHGPPSVIVDAAVTPACLSTAPSYLLVPQAYHVSGKSAAVALSSHCKDMIAITAITVDKKALAASPMRLVTIVEGYARYSDFNYAAQGRDCVYPLGKPRRPKAKCKNLVIAPEDTLTIPISWGSAYEITGAMDGEKVSATGTILNPRDPAQAIPLSLPAAQGGDAEAQYQLSVLYNREGPKRNPAESLRWLKAAAGAGHKGAQIDLAMRYQTGEGLPADIVEACFWWELAAPKVWDAFHPALEEAEGRLIDQQLAAVRKRAQDWKPVTYTEKK